MMKNTLTMLGLLAALMGMAGAGCGKKATPTYSQEGQTAEGAFKQIQVVRQVLDDAIQKKDLQVIHDNMYYLSDLLKAMSAKLEGDKKQRVDTLVVDMLKLAEQIDNAAGRGNFEATEATLTKMQDSLKGLESEFGGSQKKK